jgi:putative Ca2+/H+ antiporter (TMEM165/GDT1 family)
MMMNFDPAAFLFSGLTVVIAEMGDKTQLLAMAFALKFKWWKVMIGVFAATVLNHALAVALGSALGRIESAHFVIQVLASVSFILFGLWTIKGDELGDEAEAASRFGPIITVSLAFFLAEMGDKTQIATIALASKYPLSPLGVLMGSTSGMILADGFGIIVGVVLCRRIPERAMKIGAALIFISFGLGSCFALLREELAMGLAPALALMAGIAALAGAAWMAIARGSPPARKPSLAEAACEDRAPTV